MGEGVRNRLLIDHSGFPRSLSDALQQRGLELQWGGDIPPGEAGRYLGCVIWFYEGIRSPYRIWRLSHRLRRLGIPLLAWNQDAPHYLNRAAWRMDWYDWMRLLDVYASHSLADRRRFAASHLYLPNAADTRTYGLGNRTLAELRDPGRYRYDVSFVGAMNGDRYKEMKERQAFFAALGERLDRLGISYLFREAAGMSVAEQIETIQTTRINLNFGASCDYGSPVASGLPERCYGIPACGGFLLCDRRTHAQDDFTPGVNWAEFDGLEDCVGKISHWLAHFGDARDLAERCRAHVMAHHTYAQRAASLHRALLDWHGGQRGRLA